MSRSSASISSSSSPPVGDVPAPSPAVSPPAAADAAPGNNRNFSPPPPASQPPKRRAAARLGASHGSHEVAARVRFGARRRVCRRPVVDVVVVVVVVVRLPVERAPHQPRLGHTGKELGPFASATPSPSPSPGADFSPRPRPLPHPRFPVPRADRVRAIDRGVRLALASRAQKAQVALRARRPLVHRLASADTDA